MRIEVSIIQLRKVVKKKRKEGERTDTVSSPPNMH